MIASTLNAFDPTARAARAVSVVVASPSASGSGSIAPAAWNAAAPTADLRRSHRRGAAMSASVPCRPGRRPADRTAECGGTGRRGARFPTPATQIQEVSP
jgi:hypothetical protein